MIRAAEVRAQRPLTASLLQPTAAARWWDREEAVADRARAAGDREHAVDDTLPELINRADDALGRRAWP